MLSAFAVRDFRALWAAEAISQTGDQLARVALSVLVFERTSSAGLTALAYGLTYLPTFLGGVVFSRLADRYPRRAVMVTCDVCRLLVAGCMAVPGTPFAALCGLLVVLTVAGGPARAAMLAMLPGILSDAPLARGPNRPGRDRSDQLYIAGLGVRQITIQSTMVAGFGLGGLVIGLIGPYLGLALNAATFLASALLVWFGVSPQPAAAAAGTTSQTTGSGDPSPSSSASTSSRWSTWFGNGAAAVRAITMVPGGWLLFGWKMLAGLYVIPEGLAAPLAAQLGGTTIIVGFILGADAIGSVLGAWAYTRWVPPAWRPRLTGWLAAASGLPLILILAAPGIALSVVLIGLSGVLSQPYQMQATATITRTVPDTVRGQVSGFISTALVTIQGVGIVLAGAAAQVVGPSTTIGCAALIGVGLGVAGSLAWARTVGRQPQSELTA